MAAEDLNILGQQLLYIDEQKFREVVSLLEHMGHHPEVQKTFSLIRPRLAEVKPRRRPTLKRVFCEPFEDLFEPPMPGDRTPVDAIERVVVNRLWPLVEAEMGTTLVADLSARLKSADGPALEELSLELWTAGAAAVIAVTAKFEAGRLADELDIRLNPGRVRQLQHVGNALGAAGGIVALKKVLAPKPVAKLHEDHLQAVQAIGKTLARSRPEALRVLVLVAAARLADPSMLLGSLWNLDFGQKPADRAALFAEVSGGVVAQIENRVRVLKDAAAHGNGKPDRLAAADLAVDLVTSLDATRGAMEVSRRNEFDKRLKDIRGAVHEMVRSQVLQEADGSIIAGITPATGGLPDRESLLRAENHARALRKCAVVADSLGLRTELRAVTDRTIGTLTSSARQALGSAGTVGGGSKAGYTAVRLIELIAGPAEANRVLTDILEKNRPL